jgi:Xaa-Pro aminopeptidase
MNRIPMVQKLIRQKKWDGLWISGPANRRYLSGFTGSAGWLLIPAKGKAYLITDGRYTEQASQESPDSLIMVCKSDPLACLGEQLKQKSMIRLGFEDDQIVVREWEKLKKMRRGLRGEPANGLVEKVRAVKNPEEVTAIRKAIRIAEQAYAKLLPLLKPGIREIDIAHRLEQLMAEAGSEALAFPTIVASGPRSSLPHAQPTDRKLQAGDLMVLDFGAVFQGYHSDLTRTVAIARMTPRQQEFYKIVKKAQKSAKNLLVSNQLAADSDKKCRELLQADDLEKYFVHSLGHGIGLEIHEAPRLSTLSQDRLSTNMVVTCEPGIYIPGWGGIRIEDDVLVGSGSAQWLSQSPDTLPVVGGRKK